MIEWLSELSGPMIYVVVVALVFGEDAVFVGVVLPGETAVIVGGVLAKQGAVNVWLLSVAVVLAAVAGDSAGYEVGRRLGPAVFDSRMLRHRAEGTRKARELMRRRGAAAVFVGRFIALFRTLVPALAGAARMPYRLFLVFNVLGALIWGVGNTFLGYAAGAAYERAESMVGRAVALTLAVLVVAALAVWGVRRHADRQ